MSGPLTEYLLNLEELAWEANGKGDADFYASYLTNDAIAVASTGRYDKATVLAALAERRGPAPTVRIRGPRLMSLGPDVALLTYHATVKTTGKTFGVYAATVYVRRGGVWYAAFNQLTPQEGGA